MKRISAMMMAMGMAIAAPAAAEPYQFTITGDYSASFVVDSSPTPDNPIEGAVFAIYDVPGFPDASTGVADLTFYSGDQGGGLVIHDYYGASYLLSAEGPQLYSGSESAPTFLTGNFALTEYLGAGTYSLTIAPVTAAVPEPASWAFMIGGVGVTGGALRARRKTAAARPTPLEPA
jgi:hypothetical protein